MHLSVGDKVRFLDDVGEGTISKIIDDKMVGVATEDDFERPVLISELVKVGTLEDYGSEEEGSTEILPDKNALHEEKNKIPDEIIEVSETVPDDEGNEEIPETEEETRVLVGFVPSDGENITGSDLNTYLINDSNYYLLYNIVIREEGYTANISSGELEPDTKLFLSVYERRSLNYLTGFIIQIILYKKGIYEPLPPVEKTIRIKPVRFYLEDNYKENDFFDEPAIIIPVFQEQKEEEEEQITEKQIRELIRKKQENIKVEKKASSIAKSHDHNKIEEIDLHIQQLIEDYRGLSNSEILNIQIGHFRSSIENALTRNIKKIVFIHGIGNGTLKLQLRKSLETEYTNLKYQDASFKEYGYGATLVILR